MRYDKLNWADRWECDSEVVDVFTSAPPDQNGFGSRVQSVDQLHIANSAKRTGEDTEQANKEKENEQNDEPDVSVTESEPAVPQEMAYRSVRKLPDGLLSSKPDQETNGASEGYLR